MKGKGEGGSCGASALGEHWLAMLLEGVQLPPSSPGGADGGDAISKEVIVACPAGLEAAAAHESSRLIVLGGSVRAVPCSTVATSLRRHGVPR